MLIVDRIVGDIAVCEAPGRTMLELPLAELPQGVREGDCIVEEESGYRIDAAKTKERREAMRQRLDRLLMRENGEA